MSVYAAASKNKKRTVDVALGMTGGTRDDDEEHSFPSLLKN